MQIVIVGGGWAGCAAACAARRLGARAVLLERSDMLLGTGLVGGIMRNNGRYTAAEELLALGGGELMELADRHSRHQNLDFPGHRHASLYDIAATQGAVTRRLIELGVQVQLRCRIDGVRRAGKTLQAVTAGERVYTGDVFIDATGTAGPMANCKKYGNGCAMCALRCPSFGGRVSLTGLCGVPETQGSSAAGAPGAMSGSCKLMMDSLAPSLAQRLRAQGCVVLPLPEPLREDHLAQKACQQYALPAYRDNLILLDTGHAKLMAPYFPLEKLRRVPGLENARYEDPYAGGAGNSMRFFALAPRNDALQVEGMDNLLCAGEKAGLLVGHTEAMVTGALAGHNAVRVAAGLPPLILPRSLAVGEGIAFTRERMAQPGGLTKKYTFSGSVLWERLHALQLYATDRTAIEKRVEAAGLSGALARLPH